MKMGSNVYEMREQKRAFSELSLILQSFTLMCTIPSAQYMIFHPDNLYSAKENDTQNVLMQCRSHVFFSIHMTTYHILPDWLRLCNARCSFGKGCYGKYSAESFYIVWDWRFISRERNHELLDLDHGAFT